MQEKTTSANTTVIAILLVVFLAYGLWNVFKATWGYFFVGGVLGAIGLWTAMFVGGSALIVGGLWYFCLKAIFGNRKK